MSPSLFATVCVLLIGAAGAALLTWLALVRPRLGLYLLFASTPTQFIFVPVGTFFISPADVLVIALGAGFCLRLASGSPHARSATRLHIMLGLMLVGYLVGFVVLGQFSRTLIRVPMAIMTSVLACELLRTRRHVTMAIGALIVAATVDAAYGLAFVAIGHPLHPTRFSGMMGVNFSAMIMLTGASMALALFARTRQPVKLVLPLSLATLAVATLSRTGLLALGLAGAFVLWRIASRQNRRFVLTAGVLGLAVIGTQVSLVDRVRARGAAEVEQDGIERTSGDVRVLILRSAWHALKQQPLTGIGYFNFQPYSTHDPDIRRSTFGVGYATHNTYLEVLVEGGLLAFLPFLLHFASYWRPLRPALTAMIEERDVVSAAALSGLLVVLVTAAAANVLVHYLFWSVAGAALACFRLTSGEPAVSRSFDRPMTML
jgi:O-antigen ligase